MMCGCETCELHRAYARRSGRVVRGILTAVVVAAVTAWMTWLAFVVTPHGSW